MGGLNVVNEEGYTLEIEANVIKGITKGSKKEKYEETLTITVIVDYEAKKQKAKGKEVW